MDSSDSEDDCYGNAAQKLLNMKKKYEDDTLDKSQLLDDSFDVDKVVQHANLPAKIGNDTATAALAKSSSASTDEPDDLIIQQLIANNPSRPLTKRVTRSASRRSCANDDNLAATEASAPKRGRRGRGRGRGRGNINLSTIENPVANFPCTSAQCNIVNNAPNVANTSRSNENHAANPPRTARSNRRGRQRSDFIAQCLSFLMPSYSVGNTDEYPDQCDDQALFSSTKPTKVITIDEEPTDDDNEELSVKVYWQSTEFFKFRIRKFQKICQIFDHFASKENVGHDKLLLTYNEKILNQNDTPDSMNYSVAKFIDGGIVNQSIAKLVTSDCEMKDGIKLKFQIQNVKKPIEIMVKLDDKFSIAMMKCAEHLEKPIDSLRFLFDGDSVSGKTTARELELEGGECIDVKIMS